MSVQPTFGRDALFSNLEQAFVAVVKELRDDFVERDMPNISFKMTADGRTTGDLRITVYLDDTTGFYGDDKVKGRSISAVLEEFNRRKGYTAKEGSLLLTFDDTVKPEDGVPS